MLLAAAQHGVPVREATPERGQDGDRRATGRPTRSRSSGWSRWSSGMAERPRPDDAADALAIAVWGANTAALRGRRGHGGRDGSRGRSRRSRAAARATSGPCARRSSARSRRARRAPPSAPRPRRRRVIASVEGVVGAITADSLVIEVGGIGYRVFAAPADPRHGDAGRPAEAPHVPPRPRGPAGAVRLPDGGGARVLQPAADRERRRTQGRPGDRRLAPDRRPPAGDHDRRPGRPRVASRASARSSPSGSSSSSRRRSRRPASRRSARPVAGGAAGEGEVVAALQALGYSLAEAREASRAALADVGVGEHARGSGQGGAAEPAPRLSAESADPPLLDPRRVARRTGPAPTRHRSRRSAASLRGTRRPTTGSRG